MSRSERLALKAFKNVMEKKKQEGGKNKIRKYGKKRID